MCIYSASGWRRLKSVCSKKRLIIGEIEKEEYSAINIDLEIPKQVVGNNILLLV
jgi:hypothetical protein